MNSPIDRKHPILSTRGGIAYLTLNAPPNNEMDALFFHRLAALRLSSFASLQVNGMIVRGQGRHFSSGANVKEIEQLAGRDPEQIDSLLKQNMNNFSAIEDLPFPIVAAIGGCCLGAGMELALACHHRIASTHAVFGLPEATFDLMPGCGGTVRLTGLVGKKRAMELILTGRTVPADEALELGIVDQVVDRKEVAHAAARYINNYKEE